MSYEGCVNLIVDHCADRNSELATPYPSPDSLPPGQIGTNDRSANELNYPDTVLLLPRFAQNQLQDAFTIVADETDFDFITRGKAKQGVVIWMHLVDGDGCFAGG